MKITYHGHACFTVESEGYSIVLDPFKGVEGLGDTCLEANEVSCSHEHFDHFYKEGVKLTEAVSPFKVSKLHVFHDDCNGEKRGPNDITILEAEGKKLVHFGDLGHVLSEEQLKVLENSDVLMIPVGGFYTIDAKTAAQIVTALNPKYIVPMHYKKGDLGLQVVAPVDEFTALLSEEQKAKLLLVNDFGGEVTL